MAYGLDALQPTNLVFEGAHSTLEFNQDDEDLAKKREQVLEMTKWLLEKARKPYEEQVDAGRREVEYEVVQNGVDECEQLHLVQRPHSKVHVLS
jgi:hypothetical protein